MTYSFRSTAFLLSTTLATSLILSGCNMKRPDRVDGKLVLNGLPSPDVKGIDDSLLDSASSAEKKGDYRHASQFYRQLIDKEPDNIDFKKHFADASRRAEMFKPAIDAYEDILRKEPDNIDALEGKGLTMLSQGNFDGATDTLGQVIAKDKTRWKAFNGLGILFAGKGMHDEAIAYFSEALTQSPNNIRVLNNIGLTLAISKQLPDAIKALTLASSLVPNDEPRLGAQVDLNLALVYGIAGDIDHAEAMASKHLSGPALNNNLGLYAHLAKDDVMARSYLDMALSGSTHFYDRAWSNLGILDKSSSANKNLGAFQNNQATAQPTPKAPKTPSASSKPTRLNTPTKNTKAEAAAPQATAPTPAAVMPPSPTPPQATQKEGAMPAPSPVHITSEIEVQP